ncbi:RlpA-like double-psi beta-barrel-protein domain-containing protein-containing protein [Scleroderma yunnanense]
MAPLAKCFVLLSLALFASALATPHLSRNVHHHRAIVLPKAVEDDRVPVPAALRRKRSFGKRCVPSSSNATTTTTTTTGSTAPTAPINVAANPASYIPSSSLPAQEPASSSPSSPSPAPAPSTTSPAAPATTSTSSSSGSGSYPSYMTGMQSGQGTYYSTGLGACGITNNDNQLIAAVSEHLFDSYPGYNGVNPNTNPVCGKQVTASYNGKSTTVTITDRCTGCATTDLDFSPSAFGMLADLSLGRIDITWSWS